MIYAAIFGALDVILILAFTTRKFRILEQMFILFVSVISFGFLYEVFIIKPDPSAILYHSFVPLIANSNALLISVGIIGATVMPHALFVHSWLTKNKLKDKSIQEKRTLRKLHLTETVVILTIAGMVNATIMIIAAAVLTVLAKRIPTARWAVEIIRQGPIIVMNTAESLVGIVVLDFGSDPIEHGDALRAWDRLRSRPPLQCEQEENVECAVASHDIASVAQLRPFA